MTHPHEHLVDGTDHRDQCVALVPIFAHLTPSERHDIAQRAHQKTYGRNEQLYGAGEQNPTLMIVHEGRVKIYRISESGREQLIRILCPGDFIGETSFMGARESDHFAVTLEDSKICALHRDDVKGFLSSYPAIAVKMLETVSDRLEQTERMVSSLTGDDVERRVASYLMELADASGSDSLELPLSKKDVASYLGTTPETLSRRLAVFEDSGWIVQQGRGRIHILDRAALAAL